MTQGHRYTILFFKSDKGSRRSRQRIEVLEERIDLAVEPLDLIEPLQRNLIATGLQRINEPAVIVGKGDICNYDVVSPLFLSDLPPIEL